MARQKAVTPATIFPATVRMALEHITEPHWLGRHSPLASPYFLGQRPSGEDYPTGERERGALLQAAIREAVDAMWGTPLPASRDLLAAAVDADRAEHGSKSSRYHYFLLELRYLRRHYPPNTFPTAVESMPGYVNVSPTRFFIHLDEAIDELGRVLLNRFNPALRLERPTLVRAPVGRETTVSAIAADLQAGRSVAITGQGGVGKTTVGASLVAAWEGEVFWHTFHPGLNDDLNSLLFSLGHFTRAAGAPTLWAQLLAGEGRIVSISQAIGMLRIDLEHIAARRPLLCFDEVDLLQTAAGDPRRKQHAQVLELLESLRGVVPLLLIGQRIYVDTGAHYALKPLPRPVTDELLRLLAVDIDAITAQRVQQFTDGNPRLLELYAAVWHSGDDASDVFRLPREASAQPLFSRLWRRLDPEERELLSALSVFRSYAPRDAWATNEASLTELAHRGLIKTDLGSGVGLLPFIRDLVYEALTPERQQHFHQGAAHIRALRGDYTAAAYHYVQGGLPDAAVEIWFAHQEEEILSGQAAAAETLFREIKAEHVKGTRRAELRVIQNRLALLAGEVESVLEGMEAFRWDVEDETTADAIGQWAYAYELRDQNDLALEKYEAAIAMLSRAITKTTFWHRQRGFTFTRDSNPEAARREALQAMSDIERLQGMIDYWSGQFESAQNHYLISLQFAEDAHDKSKIARSHVDLSAVAGRQGRIEEGREHAEIAIAHYAELGDRLAQESMRAELAGMYLNVRQFETVIDLAEKCLPFFERIKHERWVAAIANNLAEAYLETGHLDKSRAMVFRVLRMEIAPMRPHALYTLGHIHDREDNPAHAAVSFREGIEVARVNGDPFIEAYLLRALGALLVKGGQADDGLEHLDNALKLFGGMGLEQEAAATAELREGIAPKTAVTV